MCRRVLALLFCFAAVPAAAAGTPCKLTAIGDAQVTSVRDGRTLLLADGRELRLAAIEAGDDGAALQALAAGASLRLARLDDVAQDRYGRLIAFAYAGDAAQSLQERLLELGQARVSARIGDKPCAEGLLALEKAARTAKRGLWADPNFAPLAAENLARLSADRGRFVLIEGKVLSVRESGATIYVNFGRRWTRDFSATIPRRLKAAFTNAGVEPKGLEGRRIRVRGWLERRAGPTVDVTAPEQIEYAE